MFVTGVGANLSPFEITLTWLSVSWRFEKSLMNFSLFCLLVEIRFIAKIVLRCLHLLFALHPGCTMFLHLPSATDLASTYLHQC